MAKWLAKEFDWTTGRYTGRYYDIAEAGIVAVFVDSFYGDDTAAGTAAAPFKTLSKAITTLNSTGANGSRIFMNGIFTEALASHTFIYDYIGCGGGRNGKTIFYNAKGINRYRKLHNVEFINFLSSGGWTGISETHYAVNCIIRDCRCATQSAAVIAGSGFFFCKLIDFIWQGGTNPTVRAFDSIFLNALKGGVSALAGSRNYFKLSPDSSGAINTAGSTNSYVEPNINLITAQFIDVENNDFNVRITSPLIGTGGIDEITGNPNNIGGVSLGLPYNGLIPEFSESGGATITDLTVDATGKYTITAPATTGTLETALMDLGNIYPLENIDLFNVFDFASGEITQGVFETFSSPRMALTIKLKYGLTSAEVDDCPWLLIEYGKQPTFSGTGASRVGNAADTFDPDTFQTITCRYMKLFITLQNNS